MKQSQDTCGEHFVQDRSSQVTWQSTAGFAGAMPPSFTVVVCCSLTCAAAPWNRVMESSIAAGTAIDVRDEDIMLKAVVDASNTKEGIRRVLHGTHALVRQGKVRNSKPESICANIFATSDKQTNAVPRR